jgi:class 3 adenylate cyclase
MDINQCKAVRVAVEDGLDRAEFNWGEVGHLLKARFEMAESYSMDSADSNIPGYPVVQADRPKVDEFIALVVDMRDSTKRLRTKLNGPKVNGLNRVYYETSALLPAIAVTCGFQDGTVTEYLGDGALVLFGVDKEDRHESVRRAYRAAKNCINDMRFLINEAIAKRYNLPAISLGAGLAMSKAMVTLVGVHGNYQPKAIGSCVWDATKLSGGTNAVHVSPEIKGAWPTSEGGLMRFKPLGLRHVEGFKMYAEPATSESAA